MMAQTGALPASKISVSLRFAMNDLMRPEMVKLLLSKVSFSDVASDTVTRS